jgi:hypothetical protein
MPGRIRQAVVGGAIVAAAIVVVSSSTSAELRQRRSSSLHPPSNILNDYKKVCNNKWIKPEEAKNKYNKLYINALFSLHTGTGS